MIPTGLDLQTPRPVTIGIAGGTGSGKTTVSRELRARVGQDLAYLQHDSYYKDLDEMPVMDEWVNWDHPNALDTTLMVEHIRQLQRGEPAFTPVYDFTQNRRVEETRRIDPKPIILVEGILIFAEAHLRDLFDMRIFVDADPDIRFIRRLQRDIDERGRTAESVIKQYLGTVRPMHLEFVEPSKRYAHVIIPRGGRNVVAIEMVADRIKGIAAGSRYDE
jgi:uridine kinase